MNVNTALQEAEFFIERKRYQDAKLALQKYFQTDINNFYAFGLMGLVEIQLDNLELAQLAIASSLALYPDYDFAHYLRGIIFLEKENTREAEQCIKEAIRIEPNEPSYFNGLARCYYAAGKFREGRDAVMNGLKINPNNTELLELKALYQIDGNNLSEALETVKQGLKENPNNPRLLYLLGNYAMDDRKFDEAEIHFKNALSINPMMEEARMGLVEIKKANSSIFRIFHKYGFSRWTFEFGWRFFLWIIIGIKTVFIWGVVFVLFLLFTWWGDVMYNSVLRLGKTSKYLLTSDKIKQSNYFLIVNGVIVSLILLAKLTGLELFWKGMLLAVLILFMGLAYLEVNYKRQRQPILVTGVILLSLALLGINIELFGFVIIILLLLILFGLLFSFRAFGN